MKTLNNNNLKTNIMKTSKFNSKINQQKLFNMKNLIKGITLVSIFAVSSNVIAQHDHNEDGHDVVLHENSLIESCDFDISSDLTQADWKRANKEIGNLLFLNPLASAKPLGKFKWDLTLEMSSSTFDENSGAWNNTFSHPDSTHYLSDNDRVSVPGFRFRMGVTDKLDVGVYYAPSQPFGANYGFLGFEGKYSFINDTIRNWSSSVRLSYVQDFPVEDFDMSVTGLDVSVSKTFFNILTPYAGVATNWNYSREKTDEVDLKNESHIAVRGIIGAELRWKFVNLGYEVMVGDEFNNSAVKLGVTF